MKLNPKGIISKKTKKKRKVTKSKISLIWVIPINSKQNVAKFLDQNNISNFHFKKSLYIINLNGNSVKRPF